MDRPPIPDGLAALPQEELRPPEYSDEEIAREFERRHGNLWAYVAPWQRWLYHGGEKWEHDARGSVRGLIRALCREIATFVRRRADLKEPQRDRLSAQIASYRTVQAVESMCRADINLAKIPEQFDCDKWVLNVPTGVVDLRTGDVRRRTEADLFTKVAGCSPDDRGCPRWLSFLDWATHGDDDLQCYLQRFCGYALTGSTQEHSFHFLFGPGGNGKSVFVNVLTALLGDYAISVPMEVFLEQRGERHPTELAMLRGARLAVAQEVADGRKWAEGRIKQLSGEDEVSARFMRADFFTFRPQAKILVVGNHRPGLRSVDDGIRRRLHLIPFDRRVEEGKRDKQLIDTLLEELPGIMQWAIDGCIEWQVFGGLNPPDRVRAASEGYLEGQDVLGQWMEDCVDKDPAAIVATKDLHANYQAWATQRGERFMGEKTLSQALEDRGEVRTRTARVRGFLGLRLRGELGL